MFQTQRTSMLFVVGCALVLFLPAGAVAQSGHTLPGVGATNLGMAGVATGNASDSLGTLHWNPGGIAMLQQSSFTIGFEGFLSKVKLASAAPDPGSGMIVSGDVEGNAILNPIPSFGVVYNPPDKPWAFGLAAFGIGGFGVDLPVDADCLAMRPGCSPANSPPATAPGELGGFGAIYSNYQLLQIAPTFAYKILPWLSAGIAPTLNWSSLSVTPFPATTDDANGDMRPSYPSAARTDSAYGAGFQVGVYGELDFGLRFGVSLKSRQWFEGFKFTSENEVGGPLEIEFDLDYPMIISAGVSYQGLDDKLIVGADFRYIDYDHTPAFDDVGFDARGAVKGFGWQSIFVAALGAQYQVAQFLQLRAGYSFNPSAIEDENTFFNTPAPGIIEHQIFGGASVFFDPFWSISLAYRMGLENSIHGPMQFPGLGAVPMSDVEATLSTHSFAFSLNRALNL